MTNLRAFLNNPHQKFVLAPMAGITNAPFRQLMKELGASIVVSELISATGIQYKSEKTLELCRFSKAESPVGLQIFGETKEHLAEAAQHLAAMGVDFIDINFGCPVPKVVSKGAGAAMLKDPEKLYETLKFVRSALSIPLTIKIRTGWCANTRNALENIQAAQEAGVTWVAIHGRTRAQAYEGSADWEFMHELQREVQSRYGDNPIPLIGNGDILTAEQALHRLATSGMAGVMIGRGALRNPFIFRDIAHIQGRKVIGDTWTYWDLIERHLELLRAHFNDFYVGIQLRKFLTWYSAGIDGASLFRKNLYAENSTDEVIRLAKNFFDTETPVAKCRSFMAEPFLQGGHG